MKESKAKPQAAKRASRPKPSHDKDSAAATPAGHKSAARRIDERIRSLGDWRGRMLSEVRRLIHEVDPDIVEEVKWVKPTNPWGVPVWSHSGIVCTGEVYRQLVKLTFARGASLPDRKGLFNSSLAGNSRRAIDIREGDRVDAQALKALIQAAVAENVQAKK